MTKSSNARKTKQKASRHAVRCLVYWLGPWHCQCRIGVQLVGVRRNKRQDSRDGNHRSSLLLVLLPGTYCVQPVWVCCACWYATSRARLTGLGGRNKGDRRQHNDRSIGSLCLEFCKMESSSKPLNLKP